MSKILRRPMFRGGPVNSYNTGITSGLDDSGYANGGNVIPKRGLVDGPGGYAGDFNYSRDTGLGRFMPKFNEYAFREPLAAAYNLVGVPLNKATEFVTGYNPGFSGERLFNLDMKNRKPDTAEFFGMNTGAKRGFTYQNESQQKIEDQKLKDTALKDDYELRMQKLKDDYEKRIEGLKGAASPELTEEDLNEQQIRRESKLYEKLLGGEEARSQSVYDALLAAAPAFFKGRNLREAAPQVLESINKSGAFDKPRDIKQAAAQLAIQRKILMDKASAEAKTKEEIVLAGIAGRDKSFEDRIQEVLIRNQGVVNENDLFTAARARLPGFKGKLTKNDKGELVKLQPNSIYLSGLTFYETDEQGNLKQYPIIDYRTTKAVAKAPQ